MTFLYTLIDIHKEQAVQLLVVLFLSDTYNYGTFEKCVRLNENFLSCAH
jgi:hypothetical protein